MNLIYKVNDRPPFGKLVVFAIQQLLAIMAATLVVPVITGHGMSSAAALFGAGVGTIVYLLFTLRKSPVFLGSSFAFLGSMAAAFAGGVTVELGYLGLIIGACFAGLVYVVIAGIVKAAGVNWINKLMPAVVIGPIVAIIGLSLAGNAIGDLQTANYEKVDTFNADDYRIITVADFNTENDKDGNVLTYTFGKETDDKTGFDFVLDKDTDISAAVPAEKVHTDITVNRDDVKEEETKQGAVKSLTSSSVTGSVYVAIICGLVTLFVTMLCSTYGKEKGMSRLIPFIIGILAGYAVASIFYAIGNAAGNDALKVISFAPLTNNFSDISIKSFFSIPEFTFLKAFGAFDQLDGGYIASIAVAYIPVAFVVFAVHLADPKNLSYNIGQDLLRAPGLHRTLLGDGIGSFAGAIFGGCPNTTYGESIGCVAITGNASTWTIFAAAIGAILISFITPFVAFVNSIPSCVMGGVCMALYGFIAVSGLKMLKDIDLGDNRNLFVVSTILIAGIGGLSLTFGKVTLTTVATALILGIIVNLMLSRKKDDK